jgi:O-antigen ligase/polysaccharide polymerase Wzy-like membrane protein
MRVSPSAERSDNQQLERLFLVFLTYCAFEGLVKRTTGYAWYVYPIRDLLLFTVLVYWATLQWRGRPSRVPPFSLILWFYLGLVCVEALNPHLPSIVLWLAGVRTSYVYVLLYFVAFRVFDTQERVVRLAEWVGVIAIITAVGAMIESALGLDWVYRNNVRAFINAVYVGASGSWVIRPSSIGNGPGSAAMMEYIGAFALFGLAVTARTGPRRLAALCGAGLALGGVLLSATRVLWLQAAVGIAVFTIVNGRGLLKRTLYILAPAGLAVALSLLFSGGEISTRFKTFETPLATYLTEPAASERYYGLLALPRVVSDFPLGAGVGWNAPRQDLLAPYYGEDMIAYAGVHNYLSILALEIGVLGLVVFLTFSVGVSLRGLRSLHREPDPTRGGLFAAYYALFVSMLVTFLVGGGIIGWPGEYYWILAAIVVRLPSLGRNTSSEVDAPFPLHQTMTVDLDSSARRRPAHPA